VSTDPAPYCQISVIIPARNEEATIGRIVRAVLTQAANGQRLEVVVADDGSRDDTAGEANRAGARIVATGSREGNPAVARNQAARLARGDLLIFLDADCLPQPGWLNGHLGAQALGHGIVGGSLALPPGLPWTARCDYYASAYHVHPGRKAGPVPSHTPANLSVQAKVFAATQGFVEKFPVADGHEELAWQGAAVRQGVRPYFEPAARAQHQNRPGLGNLFRRSYRWGYSALEAKHTSGAARVGALYRYPVVTMVLAYPLALLETGYIIGLWLLAGQLQTLQFAPIILLARVIYATGLVVGGVRWLRRGADIQGPRPRWR
jgi:glycosyltransferase involved in cell wall biosynthesis